MSAIEPDQEWGLECPRTRLPINVGFSVQRSVLAAHQDLRLGVYCPFCQQKHSAFIADLVPLPAFGGLRVVS